MLYIEYKNRLKEKKPNVVSFFMVKMKMFEYS